MAGLNPWLFATLALIPPFCIIVLMCLRGAIGLRLAAVQLASSTGALLLVAMTFAFDQASSIDVALTLGFLTLPATLLFALFMERWL